MEILNNLTEANNDLEFNLKEEVSKNLKVREARAAANIKFNKNFQKQSKRKFNYTASKMLASNINPAAVAKVKAQPMTSKATSSAPPPTIMPTR